MSNTVARITVPCIDPETQNTHEHRVFIYDNGKVGTPDHDAADWPQSLRIIEALGGEGDLSPCMWWKRHARHAEESSGWENGKIRAYSDVLMRTTPPTVAQLELEYDIAGWAITAESEWTPAALKTFAMGCCLDADVARITLKSAEDPAHVLSLLQHIPGDQLNQTISMAALLRLNDALEGEAYSLEDWLNAGLRWHNIAFWIHYNYTPQEAEVLHGVYKEALDHLMHEVSYDVINSMVMHTPGTLAEMLEQTHVPRERAEALIRRAPYVIYPDWPGLAEDAMPEIPEGVPAHWVSEALLQIPASGFLQEVGRTPFAIKLAQELPRRFAEDGDPASWDYRWCWPEGVTPIPPIGVTP